MGSWGGGQGSRLPGSDLSKLWAEQDSSLARQRVLVSELPIPSPWCVNLVHILAHNPGNLGLGNGTPGPDGGVGVSLKYRLGNLWPVLSTLSRLQAL